MKMIRIVLALAALAVLVPAAPAMANGSDWQSLRGLLVGQPAIADKSAEPIAADGPVVVTFFASWCPPCTDEFSHLNELVEREGDDVSVLAVNLFEDFGGKKNPTRMQRFVERTAPRFGMIEGSEDIRIAFGDIDRIPTVVVYGLSGREVWRFVHERGAEKTHATLEDLRQALELARAD